jgi:hypothetical protein
LQSLLGITYPLILLQRRISQQMVILSTSFVYFLKFSNSSLWYLQHFLEVYRNDINTTQLFLVVSSDIYSYWFFINNYINDCIR